ncbi:uncharacterized protein LOC131950030 [Physella acuta]|uniref:uncharacterized protein LOC131950030 n=1 Tax=Physella acuta TaxID=109671 RepID=UPI0027DBF5C6|nr:uncharacterized protein LOC131950030 [Physella acuta]
MSDKKDKPATESQPIMINKVIQEDKEKQDSGQEKNEKQPEIELNAEFGSFLELRNAIERYQKQKSVQLIVRDSKLLKTESTRKIIPKVYHLVNQSLMYHSITYCCKCHGTRKEKLNTRIKNLSHKRLNCQMYIRFKLSADLKKLVLFDMDETHNHGTDPTTFQLTPRQQVYRLCRMKKRKRLAEDDDEEDENLWDESTTPKKNKSDEIPTYGATPIKKSISSNEDEDSEDSNAAIETQHQITPSDSSLDSESSCSDSDEEEFRKNRQLLPFPIRLIGSAIQSSSELLSCTKELIEIQKSKLLLEKQKLLLETKHLELANSKLEFEVQMLEKLVASETSKSSRLPDTTIYLQTT